MDDNEMKNTIQQEATITNSVSYSANKREKSIDCVNIDS